MGKTEKTVALSKRLQMLADMVSPGSRVADVGCDHGFLPIYLVQTGKCPGCLAMDVRNGPLSGAEEHIASFGLGEYIATRLSDGLSAYRQGEAQTLVCSGMGGRLMERILAEGGEKSRSFSELILQPQSEIPEFRRFLRKEGFAVIQEEAVYEEGKYYFAMKAVFRGKEPLGQQGAFPETGQETEELYDRYGKRLLSDRHPVLKQYLISRRQAVEGILEQLRQKDTGKSEARQRELSREKACLESALGLFAEDC